MMIRQGRSQQHGYSLAEMLVVVAIVGIMSLVTVPQFINYMRSNRMRTSVRQFSADLRGARQRAIAHTNPTAVSITPNGRRYGIFDRVGTSAPFTWSQVGGWKNLEDTVTFLDSSFPVDSATDDSLDDIVFMPNGTVGNLPGTPRVELKTSYRVPNNHCTYTFSIAGSFTSALSTVNN